MIFDWYLGGWGLEKIKYKLEKAGRLTSMGKTKWHASVISKVLKNPFYCGTVIYRKQHVVEWEEHTREINCKKKIKLLLRAHTKRLYQKKILKKYKAC